MHTRHLLIALCASSLLAVGCGGSDTTDAGPDSPTGMVDAGTDVGAAVDAPVVDAPRDAPDAPRTPIGPATITIQETCPAFTACGGDPVGMWTYQSICIEEAGIESLFAGTCPGTEILSGSGSANGVVTITPTTITRMIDTDVTAQVQVGSRTCINICATIPGVVMMMVPGATASCTRGMDGMGNATCLCDVVFTSTLDESNTYEIQGGNTIVTDAGTATERTFEYCIEPDGSLRSREVGTGMLEPGISTATSSMM